MDTNRVRGEPAGQGRRSGRKARENFPRLPRLPRLQRLPRLPRLRGSETGLPNPTFSWRGCSPTGSGFPMKDLLVSEDPLVSLARVPGCRGGTTAPGSPEAHHMAKPPRSPPRIPRATAAAKLAIWAANGLAPFAWGCIDNLPHWPWHWDSTVHRPTIAPWHRGTLARGTWHRSTDPADARPGAGRATHCRHDRHCRHHRHYRRGACRAGVRRARPSRTENDADWDSDADADADTDTARCPR
jgi:hypothetical protein